MERQWAGQIREGMDLYDVDGDKIGSVGEVASGRYLRASTGFLGLGRELYIPFSAIADVRSDGIHLSVDKDDIGRQDWDMRPASHAAGSFEDEDLSSTAGRAEIDAETRGGRDFQEADTLELRGEDLEVRKRRVQAGEVEVGKRVVEEEKTLEVPVEREEVFIERRPVDREVSGDADFGEDRETIRVPVSEEHVDVDKRTRVTEEISVGKRAVQDTERVFGTVRREQAVIDRQGDVRVADSGAESPAGTRSWDEEMPRFRSSWQQRYGATGGDWSSAEPRYRYGWEMANRPDYRGRGWQEAEPELRRDYEGRYGDSTWDEAKDSVRDAWESLSGRAARR